MFEGNQDLNRVCEKPPWVEFEDSDGRRDEVVEREDDSIIFDLFLGQSRSTTACFACFRCYRCSSPRSKRDACTPVRYSFKVLNATTTQAPHSAQQVIPCIDQEADHEFEDLSVLTGNGMPGDWQMQKSGDDPETQTR